MADCAACGLPLQPAARYCRHCGVGVAEAGGLRSYAAARPGAAEAPRPAAQVRWGTRATGSQATGSQPTGSQATGSHASVPRGATPGAAVPRRRLRRARLVLLAIAVVALFAVAAATTAATAITLARRYAQRAQPATVPGIAAPVPATSTTPPPATPPSAVVELADSLKTSPYAPNVVVLFRRYFDSINSRNYDHWLGALSRDRRPETREKFLDEYSTTVDDEIKIVGITTREDGTLLVAVSFRSRQDPKYAPPDQPVACLLWQIVYPLTFEDGALKIALVEFVNRTYRPCSG